MTLSPRLILLTLIELTCVKSIGLNIKTKDDFIEFSERVNKGNTFHGSTVLLTDDLDMEGLSCVIGEGTTFGVFKGTFNGQGYTINNLNITSALGAVGLFGTTLDATLQNIFILKNCYIYYTPNNATSTPKIGGIAGFFTAGEGRGTIENVISLMNIFFFDGEYKEAYIGGISGQSIGMSEAVTIRNSVGMSTINLLDEVHDVYVGGISGMVVGDILQSSVINCNNIGKIYVGDNVSGTIGGVVGRLLKSTVSNCINAEPVDGDVDKLSIGDIVGKAENAEISYCYNSQVNGYEIVGDSVNTSISKSDSYNENYLLNESAELCNDDENDDDDKCGLVDVLGSYVTKNKIDGSVKWVLNKDHHTITLSVRRFEKSVEIKTSSAMFLLIPIMERDPTYFYEWYADREMTEIFNESSVNNDINIYGDWKRIEKDIKITFDVPGISQITARFGTVVSLPTGCKGENGLFVGMWVDEYDKFVPWNYSVPSYDVTLYPRYIKTELETVDDVKNFSEAVNNGANCMGLFVYLNADIDFGGVAMQPIGKLENGFEGTFDGNGHVISNLNISSDSQTVGFIGYSRGMTIRNLIFDSSCEIKNSYSSEYNEIRGIDLGGFVGYCYASKQGCIADGLVSVASLAFSGSSKVDESLCFGGIVGKFYAHSFMASIINCAFYGKQTYTGNGLCIYIAGVIGKCYGLLYSSSSCEISNCMSDGNIIAAGSASEYLNIGGVVGFLHSNGVIKNSISTTIINYTKNNDDTSIGSVAGFLLNSQVELCYSDPRSGYPLYGDKKRANLVNNDEYDDNYNLNSLVHINTYVGYSLVTSLIMYALEFKNRSLWYLNYNFRNFTYVLLDENNVQKPLFTTTSLMVLLMNFVDTHKNKRFSGWYSDAELTSPFNLRMSPDNVTLYGRWEDISECYYVTYKTTPNITYKIEHAYDGEKLKVCSQNPKRDGYEFASWMNSNGYIVKTEFIELKHNITLTAMWIKTRISTPKDFKEFSEAVNSGVNYSGKVIYLDDDIDMSEYDSFMPIGDNIYSFGGVFEGQGHRISNLKIDPGNDVQYTGVFGSSFVGAEIKNVVLDPTCEIISSHNLSNTNVGGIIGYCATEYRACQIINVINFARVEATSKIGNNTLLIGGIIGYCDETNYECKINNCANYGNVISGGMRREVYMGGIIGRCTGGLLKNFCKVTNNLNYGFISLSADGDLKDLNIGGIIGFSEKYNEVNGCVNMGDINTSKASTNVGGISGNIDGTSDISDNFWYEEIFYGDFTGLNPEIQKDFVLSDDSSFLDKLKEAAKRKSMEADSNSGKIKYATAWLLNKDMYNVTFRVNNKKFVTYSSKVILVPNLIGNEKYKFKGWFKGKRSLKKVEMDKVTKNTVLYGKWKRRDDGKIEKTVYAIVFPAIAIICFIVGGKYLKGYREIKNKNKAIKDLLSPSVFDVQEPEYSINSIEWLYPSDYERPSMEDALIAAGLSNDDALAIKEKCYENATLLEEEGNLGVGITVADAAAISMYTYEFASETYEMNPYRLINNALLSKDPEELKKMRGILYLVMTALRKLPIVHGTVLHRGIRENIREEIRGVFDNNATMYRITEQLASTHEINRNEIKSDKIIVWDSLSSTSPSMDVTRAFLTSGEASGKAAGTLFIIKNGWGYDVRPYSLYQDEAEILLEPERQFKVLSTIPAELTVVELEMLKSPLVMTKVFGERNLKVPMFYFLNHENEGTKSRRRIFKDGLFFKRPNESLKEKSVPLLWSREQLEFEAR